MFFPFKKVRYLQSLLIISGIVFLLTFRSNIDKITQNYNKVNFSTPKLLQTAYINYMIRQHNAAHVIQNLETYGEIRENTLILVVLMDKFSSNKLSYFVSSLAEVTGIDEVLLIFSHSYYDEDMNTVIKRIDFCRVLQIFYPFSVQTHPTSFPGQHPNDCPPNLDTKKAKLIKCNGASFPDFKGRYRDPAQSEKKHHWWWTCNIIFEKMNLLKRDPAGSSFVMFLDEDFYVMDDFVYMALYLKNVAEQQPRCELLSLGTSSVEHFGKHNCNNLYTAELVTFNPKLHKVIGFDLKTWNIIISHYNLFCSFDDASWLRSLYYISLRRKNGDQFKVISSITPRVVKLSSYENSPGIQQSRDDAIAGIRNFEKVCKGLWFPAFIELYIDIELDEEDMDSVIDYTDSEGRWSDPRDQSLCNVMTKTKMKKVLMELSIE